MSADRVYCSVKGCTRWSAGETMRRKGWEAFVCGSHWRRATLREKALIRRLKRMQRKVLDLTGEVAWPLVDRERLVWAAIERRVATRPPVEPRR